MSTNRRLQPDIEDFRSYLSMLARTQMQRDLRRRHDPSDVVQLTLLQAHQARSQFRGETGRSSPGGCERSWPATSPT